MVKLPTEEEIAALNTGRCCTVHLDGRAEVFVSGPYTAGDPYMVALVVYDWTPSGPVRMSAASPWLARETMAAIVEAFGTPRLLSFRLVRLMTADWDVASEPIGNGLIVVGRVADCWHVRHMRTTDDEAAVSQPFTDIADAMAAIEIIRRNG